MKAVVEKKEDAKRTWIIRREDGQEFELYFTNAGKYDKEELKEFLADVNEVEGIALAKDSRPRDAIKRCGFRWNPVTKKWTKEKVDYKAYRTMMKEKAKKMIRDRAYTLFSQMRMRGEMPSRNALINDLENDWEGG